LFFSFSAVHVDCALGACSLHAQDGPFVLALVFFLRGRAEQTVRCEGCIIVRIIRREGGEEAFVSLSFFIYSLLVRSAPLPCAKTQTTTAVSMLMCIWVSRYLFFSSFLLFFLGDDDDDDEKIPGSVRTKHIITSGLHHQDLFLPRSCEGLEIGVTMCVCG